jgi:hypothetical protein
MYRTEAADDLTKPLFPAGAPALRPDPATLPVPSRNWLQWLGIAISAATFVAMLYQLRTVDPGAVLALVPRTPAFWVVFALYYFGPVLADWVIFRRLWGIPASGLFALTRKYVGNEILLGYIGEAYFYIWARDRVKMAGSPFGAVKDAAILSALVGNAVSLVLLALAFPVLGRIDVGADGHALYLSLAFLVASSAAVLLFRRRLFSLPAPALRFVTAVHLVRSVAVIGLAGLMWHLALPGIWLGWWVLLAALRQLLSRLPFLPNKDIAFAALAALIVGGQTEIAALLTMIAGLLLLTHVTAGVISFAAGFIGTKEQA